MADFQTFSAAIAVAQLAWQTCVFFNKVKDAGVTARKLYRKTRQLHATLQGVNAALRRREDQRACNTPTPNEAQIERNIRASIEASRQILLKIDRKLKVLNGKDELSFSTKTLAQVRLTLKQAAIARHESELDLQIQALQTSLGTLQLFGHAETQSQLNVNHDEILVRLAKFDRALNRTNTRLLRMFPDKPGSLQKVSLESAVQGKIEHFDDAEGPDGLQTLKECIRTAETVRGTFESTYDPDDISTMRFSDDFDSETSHEEAYGNSDLDETNPKDVAMANNGGLAELVGLPNLNHDEPTPLDVLSFFIDDLKEHSQKDLEAGNPKRAEGNLVEAINHAEEREKRHGIPFKDRVEVQESLAFIYQKQKKWAEARKIVHSLLQEDGASEPGLASEKDLQRSRQYLLLANVHFEMYQAHDSDKNPLEAANLQAAERFAKLAFSKRYRLRGPLSDRPDPSLLESVQALITIHEAQGRTVLAESYYRQFMATCTPISSLPDAHLQMLTGATGSDFDVIDIDELLISAIRTGDQHQIQSLLATADVNCRCSKGRTPLMHGVEQGDEVTIRKLLDHGAEINATTASGATALHHAVLKGNVRMARLLLELDGDMEAKDKNLATPLLKAVEKNHGLLVSYLLGQGANVHVKDKAGWTLLHHAAHNGAVDVLKHLLYHSHKVDVNAPCPAGKTALHYCAELTSTEAAGILLSHDADVDALDASSRSPLFFAVNKPPNEKRERFVTLLLDRGAVIEAENLPPRQRDYPVLQTHPSRRGSTVSSSSGRRESTSTMAASGSPQTGRSFWPRRFSLNSGQR